MMTSSSQPQKSVSFITWFLWCLFRVTFWIKQAFTKQWSEHQFNVPYHVTHTVTWWKHVTSSEWRHPGFCHVIMGSHDIPIYSILKCSNRTKFTCNFSLYMWGVTSKIATIFKVSLESSHFIFEINVEKRRIRHTTTLNDEFLDRLRIDWRWRHSNSESLYVGSASFRHWFQK